MLTVRRGKMQQVRAMLGQQRVRREVRAEATARKNHGSVLLHGLSAKLVLTTDDSTSRVLDELVDARLADNLGLRVAGVLRDLLQHLDEGVRDRHTRKALRTTMRARLRVAAKASNQRQVQPEVVHEPLDIRARVLAENLESTNEL